MTIKVSISEVRKISGAPVKLISDDDIKIIISLTSTKSSELFGVEFEPTKKIEILTGNWKNKILLDEYFPLKVLQLKNGDTDMDLTNIFTHTDEGMLQIYGNSLMGQYSHKFSGYNLQIKCKYLYGAIEKNNKLQTESSLDVLAGSNVSITVDSTASFSDGDYIFLESIDAAYEMAKVITVDTNTTMTIDKLNNDYPAESLVTNSKTMEVFNQYVLYESAIAVAINAIGATYTVNTSYNLGSLSAVKGVPYTHWQSSTEKNIKQRDELKGRIKSLLGSII